MRLSEMFGRNEDDGSVEPEVQRDLSAVDAGLAGLEVHPDHGELASLAAAIRDEAPDIDAEFAAMLDERAAAGFPRTSVPAGARGAARRAGEYFGSLRVRKLVPVLGAVTSLVVVIAVGASVLNNPGQPASSSSEVTSSAGQAAKPSVDSAGSGGSARVHDQLAAPSLNRATTRGTPLIPGE